MSLETQIKSNQSFTVSHFQDMGRWDKLGKPFCQNQTSNLVPH